MKNTLLIGITVVLASSCMPLKFALATVPEILSPSVKRPRICLVLSGGGARGAAHAGVLKVLEEYRVPIDCIAGTSMGALIGASYATGMTVPEMEKVTGDITNEKLFKDNPPRQELSMRRKADDYKPYFGPEIGLTDGSLKLPKGAVSGIQLETVLRQLSRAKGYHDFDTLPIPFRAVATDLVTGKAVVFSDGEIANVMRASMSVPGAVAPAEIDGMLLVDGMLTSNLPVETARAMGADIVIAVNVGTPLLKREQLSGIFGVTGQMLSILTEQNVQASLATLKPDDILISPELGDYSTGDFDDLVKIIPLGEVAARKVASRLAALSIPADEYAALRKRQQAEVLPDLRPVDEIQFQHLQRVQQQAVQKVMQTQAGAPISQATLDADMRRLYGTGDFEHVNYRYLEEPGKRVLSVNAVEKSWGPNYLRFGLGLSSDFSGDSYFNLLASYRKSWINAYGAEWRTDLQIGRSMSLGTEFYQPLEPAGRFFIAPHAALERRTVDLYQGDRRIATYDAQSALAGVDLGVQLQQYGVFRLGVLGGVLRPKLDTGPASLSPGQSDVRQGAVIARLLIDQIDSVHFPRTGYTGGLNIYKSAKALGADVDYTKWNLDANAAYSFGEHTFNLGFRAAGKLGSNPLPRYDLVQWGGFLQQSGLATGQLVGDSLRFARVMYYHRILKSTLLEGAYGGVSLETGKVGNPLVPGNVDGYLTSASVFLAADSPVGPAYLGYGRVLHGGAAGGRLYFYLGRAF